MMTTYDDLSDYVYLGRFCRPATRNVGWLGPDRDFERAEPSAEILDRVEGFCKSSVAQTRGFHACEFCQDDSWHAARNDEQLAVGSAEIRVFSPDGTIYAAPTLIYHYMKVHHYRPPDEFIRALLEGPAASSQEYLERLTQLGLM